MTTLILKYKNSCILFAILFLFSINVNAQNQQKLYDEVQNIYSKYQSTRASDCNGAKNLVTQIQRYIGNRTAVPTAKAYSVSYLKKVTNPTISDLAKDRIARLKNQYKECFGTNNTSPKSLVLYNEVQNIYAQYKSIKPNDCDAVKRAILKLRKRINSKVAVPAAKAYSVNYPKKVTNPTIGDLVKDRIARIKNQFKSCFENKGMSSYVLENLPGAWKYIHNGREYQFAINRRSNMVVGSFKKHGYSYPPVYKGAKKMKDNRVRFRFELGGTHIVKLEFGHITSGTFAYISQSWTKNGEWVKLNLQPLTAKKPTPAPNVPLAKVDVTFLNETRSNAVIYWVNKGKEIKYKTLSPGQAYVQGTYSTHKWRVRLNGNVRQNYKATKDKSQLVRIK